MEWRPNADSAALLAAAQSVLEEYADYWPLSARQIFYRLVAAHGLAKTESSYDRVLNVLQRARRAELVAWAAIRDDGFSRSQLAGWSNKEAALAAIRHTAEQFTLDRQQGQERRLFIWCEAQGMAPQLERVASAYSVQVLSSGGFDSVTVKRSLGREFVDFGWVQVLHIGDHDPSGVHIFSSLAEDVQEFAAGEAQRQGKPEPLVEFERLAVTPAQIAVYKLPTVPAKRTDRRSFEGETCQCEALPPDALAAIVEHAIKTRLDEEALAAALADETKQRAQLLARLALPTGA